MVNLRIKENKEKKYFYLEHTIRKGEKFINKRVYLGTELPKDLDKEKQNFLYNLFDEIYTNKLEKTKTKFSHDFLKFPISAKKKYLENFMIRFTYNSNRIEGNTLTLKETADLLQEQITPRNKPLKEVKETESHSKVFYLMYENEKEISLKTVIYWHKELFDGVDKEIAGKIRKHPVGIARSKVELPLPAELDFLLEEFFFWFKKFKNKLNPVVFAALVHLKFVTIHPFSDGNGRISRLMMNYVLKKNNYPMLNIEYSNRDSYYNALERSQTTGKEEIFVNYLVKRYLKEYS